MQKTKRDGRVKFTEEQIEAMREEFRLWKYYSPCNIQKRFNISQPYFNVLIQKKRKERETLKRKIKATKNKLQKLEARLEKNEQCKQ